LLPFFVLQDRMKKNIPPVILLVVGSKQYYIKAGDNEASPLGRYAQQFNCALNNEFAFDDHGK